jgi:hypothetical protein
MATILTRRGDPEEGSIEAPLCFAVTDIETDGPDPGKHSMRSFASVAVDQSGTISDQFAARLLPLSGAVADPGTVAWLQSQPGAWADLNEDPKPASEVMPSYVRWLRELPHRVVFVANPLVFDALWLDWYLRMFADARLHCGPYGGERLFVGSGIDLPSLVMGTMRWEYVRCRRANYPAEWFGEHLHTHRAIDDAMGYANVLANLLRASNKRFAG